MNQPKPILTIKQKCKECDGKKQFWNDTIINPSGSQGMMVMCFTCKGTGHQTLEIIPLRDFEKMILHNISGHSLIINKNKVERNEYFQATETEEIKKLIWDGNLFIEGKTEQIPKEYEPYEIKKVSELETHRFTLMKEHNLKKDDKVVVRR